MQTTTDHSSHCSGGSELGPALGDSATRGSTGRCERLVSQVGRSVSEIRSSLGVQFYYALGMAVQKGTPFVILPLLIYFYGDQTYASYVLFYATVQIFGVLCSLATPSSTIVFWYRKEDKSQFLVTYLLLLSGIFLLTGAVCALPIYLIYKSSLKGALPLESTLLGLGFIGLYVFNQYLVSLYRAMHSARRFFVAQLMGAIILLVVAIPFYSPPTLGRLVLAFLFSVFVQDVYLLLGLKSFLAKSALRDFDSALASEVMRFSLPLVLYNAVTLFVYWVDKYTVSLYFDPASFSKFVVTFQFAFAQAMISQLFALYNFPLICELVSGRDYSKLRDVVRTYNWLTAVLGIGYSVAILVAQKYFQMFHISILGFVILSAAFLLANLSTTYLNVLYAHVRTTKIAMIQAACGAFMLIALALGCLSHRIVLCYTSHLILSACVLFAFGYTVRRISGAAVTSSLIVTDAARTALGIER
jgi:O-antigen/teichoic acid export membrane protein